MASSTRYRVMGSIRCAWNRDARAVISIDSTRPARRERIVLRKGFSGFAGSEPSQNAEIADRRLAVVLRQGAPDQHPREPTAPGGDMLAMRIPVPLP